MTSNANTSEPTNQPSDLDLYVPSTSQRTLFRHTKRDGWGLGIVLNKLDDRVVLQFQDGRSRSFMNGYYHLIDAVDRPYDVTERIVTALNSMAPSDDTPTRRIKPVSFDEQKEYFRGLFEGGFQDEEYVNKHRGDGRKRPLKRHRDALVERAKTLSKNEMQALMKDDDYAEVHKRASKIANVTDLVGAKERKAFAAIGEEHFESFAMTLHALLHGKAKLAARVDAFVRALTTALGNPPSWGLASVFLGAVHPNEHVVVQGKVLTLQAEWMAPGLAVSDSPMGLLYVRLANMAKEVKAQLELDGFQPRDMLDVCDFMWATRRPMAQKAILNARTYTMPKTTEAKEAEKDVQAA